jgi:hypothetical protein
MEMFLQILLTLLKMLSIIAFGLAFFILINFAFDMLTHKKGK